MQSALIITADGVQDQEFIYPYYRLQEADWTVSVWTPGNRDCTGILGLPIPGDPQGSPPLETDYDMLVIPGGVKAMERLRMAAFIPRFVRTFYDAGKVVASICSGAQLLISAGIVRGRQIACYPAMRVDLENAGGIFYDGAAVSFERIVSAPHYRNLGAWMSMVFWTINMKRDGYAP